MACGRAPGGRDELNVLDGDIAARLVLVLVARDQQLGRPTQTDRKEPINTRYMTEQVQNQ